MSKNLLEHPLIKDDRIALKDKDYRPSGGNFNEATIEKMEADIDKAAQLQQELGLGNVSNSNIMALKRASVLAKQIKILDQILSENPDFRVVELPGADILPRFTRKNSRQMEEDSRTRYEKPPLLVLTRLSETDSIRCSGNGNDFQANVPLIPLEGLEKLKKVLDKDKSVETYLAFMPSWEQTPQRDPILMVKLAEEYVAVHSWGGDVDILMEYILPKD